MNNNNGIISKIINFLKRLFIGSNQKLLTEGNIVPVQEQEPKIEQSNNFKEQIVIQKDTDRERLLAIRQKWEDGIIQEEEISKEDIDAIVAIYNEETEKIKQDIAKMLRELNNSGIYS